MAEAPQDTNPDELRSDLDMLIDMVNDAKHDEQAVLRHLESMKTKLDGFIHRHRAESGSGSTS